MICKDGEPGFYDAIDEYRTGNYGEKLNRRGVYCSNCCDIIDSDAAYIYDDEGPLCEECFKEKLFDTFEHDCRINISEEGFYE